MTERTDTPMKVKFADKIASISFESPLVSVNESLLTPDLQNLEYYDNYLYM